MQQFFSIRLHHVACFLIFVFFTSISIPGHSQRPAPSPEWTNFDKMAKYLTLGSGQWKAPNKQHNPNNPRSAHAFGLWFERPMRHFMSLKIVSYQKDTVLISSEGFFTWHPGEKKFVHMTSNRGGGFAEGITSFPNDSTFISTMNNFTRKGTTYEHKDENFIVSINEHRNVSYRKDEAGNWVAQSEWTWTRMPKP